MSERKVTVLVDVRPESRAGSAVSDHFDKVAQGIEQQLKRLSDSVGGLESRIGSTFGRQRRAVDDTANSVSRLNGLVKQSGDQLGRAADGLMQMGRGLAVIGAADKDLDHLIKTVLVLDSAIASVKSAVPAAQAGVGALRTGWQLTSQAVASQGASGVLATSGALTGGSMSATALVAAAPAMIAATVAVLSSSDLQGWLAKRADSIPGLGGLVGAEGLAQSEAGVRRSLERNRLDNQLRQLGSPGYQREMEDAQRIQISRPYVAQQRALEERRIDLQSQARTAPWQAYGQISDMRFGRAADTWQEASGRARQQGLTDAERAAAQQESRRAEARMQQSFSGLVPGGAGGAAELARLNAQRTSALSERNTLQGQLNANPLPTPGANPGGYSSPTVPGTNVPQVATPNNSFVQAQARLQAIDQEERERRNTGMLQHFAGAFGTVQAIQNPRRAISDMMEGRSGLLGMYRRHTGNQDRIAELGQERQQVQQHLQSLRRDQQGGGPGISLEQRNETQNRVNELNNRLLTIDQQRLAVQNQMRQTQISQLQGYQRIYETAARMARLEAEQHRQQSTNARRSLAMMDPLEQQRALRIAQQFRAGQDVGGEDLEFARGLDIFQNQVNRQADRWAGQTGMPDQIMNVLGRPQQQQGLDAEATRLTNTANQTQQQVERLMAQQATAQQNMINTTILPQLNQMSTDLGTQLGRAMQQATARMIMQAMQQLNAGQAATAGG